MSRIRALREKGLTLDQIAAETGYPRSSVGYYVKKYCGGRILASRRTIDIPATLRAMPSIAPMYVSEPGVRVLPDRVDAYLREIEKKEGPSIQDIVDGKKKQNDVGRELIIARALDALREDPETLYARLKAIEKLIKLAPFLRIDLDQVRERIGLYLNAAGAETANGPS
jgi:transcriptional regulator with XRE-family HTH domain